MAIQYTSTHNLFNDPNKNMKRMMKMRETMKGGMKVWSITTMKKMTKWMIRVKEKPIEDLSKITMMTRPPKVICIPR